jgi:glycosyltransferase involved in cell wall biosynthesis
MHKGLLTLLPSYSEHKGGWPWTEEIPADHYDLKKDWPKISIIVPSFNQGQFLEETLRSVLLQNYPNPELIVIDGDSTDESIEIIKKYEPWLTYWISEKDGGQSDAINKGMRRATGEILNWINSDDLLTPGCLKKVAEIFLRESGDVGLIHGGTTLFNSKKVVRNDWGLKPPSLERNFAGIAFPQPSAFFLKKYFDIVGGYVNEQLHYGMDYDLYCRLACVCKFIPDNDLFSRYRLHDSSKSVAEEHKFVGDWSRVFLNLCKNLKWEDILTTIKRDGILNDSCFSYYSPFKFQVNQGIINKVDKERIIFYHYCYLLKAFYLARDKEKAKNVAALLKNRFSKKWLKDEKHINQILTRLKLPSPVLNFIIELKKNYQNLLAGKPTVK